jgi:hypothetical protein
LKRAFWFFAFTVHFLAVAQFPSQTPVLLVLQFHNRLNILGEFVNESSGQGSTPSSHSRGPGSNLDRETIIAKDFVVFLGSYKQVNFMVRLIWPVTVVERSKACTVFARSEAGIVGLNPTRGMDV